MSEGRIILSVFGVIALIMIALPIGMVLTADPPPRPAHGLDSRLSKFFIASEAKGPAGLSRQVLPGITELLPPGLAAHTVFAQLSESAFTCSPDAGAANCSRIHEGVSGCRFDWRVSLTFAAGDKLKLSEADRLAKCP